MNPMWFAPPNRPLRPATDSSVAAANTVAILTLLLPQGAARSFAGLPPILYIAYNLRRCSTGKIENDYLNAINVFTCLMRYLDFCVINVPERDFHRVRPDGNAETESDVRNMTIWQKFRWNFDLFMTMRGVGWNWRVKNVEAVPMQLSRRHQLHRRWFESANSLLRRMLGVTKGSIISRYLQLYNAFFLSAVMHHVGSLNNPYSPMAWAQVAFFLMQPVAITFEDLAIYLGEQAGLEKNRKIKALGFAWVCLALSYTLRYAAAAVYAAGLGTARHPLVAHIQLTRRIFG
ncbi:hypothetical protein H2204_008500 [Knufia peltigerae]|uniref:Wax synthase domain-containing protein n=1 Tax=Knufia peltigerae TaxID=1002370 RepID=A0AA38Y016_9EURO|nr:hypothetical protein H2204_008500 [Knufia peltigerae]